jgi:hypothetical protein
MTKLPSAIYNNQRYGIHQSCKFMGMNRVNELCVLPFGTEHWI